MELEYLDTIEKTTGIGDFDDDVSPGDDEDRDAEESEEWDAWEGLNKARPERYAPLGANDSDKEHSSSCGALDEK